MILESVPDYFRSRREELMEAHPGAAFLFPAYPELLRNFDNYYQYRQESCFYYLSGFPEGESFLLLTPEGKSVLFVQDRVPEQELWTGERYGPTRSKSVFKMDEVHPNTEFDSLFKKYIKNAEKIFYRVGLNEKMDRRVFAVLDEFRASLGRTGRGLLPIKDSHEAVGEMRILKRPEEVEIMRKVCEITAQAHRRAMEFTRPGMNEYEVEALIEYEFKRQGCQRLGYESIVGGGANATCLHYITNDAPLRDGDLLLIDAAGELDYYSSDITRTFPVGGKFSPAQARIYDLVLEAQKAVVSICRPGLRYEELHKKSVRVITEGLVDLGLLKGSADDAIRDQTYRQFFPHGTGHYLGLDTHDAGLYSMSKQSRALEPGMVFTVEPGLYFQQEGDYPDEYRGIGVRIEDDILITQDGHEVLTASVPKERAEVEELCTSGG